MLKSPTSDTSSCGDHRSNHSKHSSIPNNENSNYLSADEGCKDLADELVAMETGDLAMGDEGEGSAESGVIGGGEEEEEEIYNCDNCEATFTSIADFMDHRNFDCECGEEFHLILQ